MVKCKVEGCEATVAERNQHQLCKVHRDRFIHRAAHKDDSMKNVPLNQTLPKVIRFPDAYDLKAIFTKSIEDHGWIPPISEWHTIGIEEHASTISRWLKEKYPNNSDARKQFLSDLDPSFPKYLKVTPRATEARPEKRTRTAQSQIDELKRYIEDFRRCNERTPYSIEYKREQRNPNSGYTLMRQEQLQRLLGLPSYQAILEHLGYKFVTPTNEHYTLKIAHLVSKGYHVTQEDIIPIEGRRFRVDYAIRLPDAQTTVWLEIDGSSHRTPNSLYHTSPIH